MAVPQDTTNETEDQSTLLQKQKELADLKKAMADAQKATAEAQKASADAEKAAVEAQKAALEAAFPKGQAKPLAGEITTDADKFGYVAELVAYQAMKECAAAVGKAIDGLTLAPTPAQILIVPDRSVAQGDLPLLQLTKQFELFDDLLTDQIEKNRALLGGGQGELPEIAPGAELEALRPAGEPSLEMLGIPATPAAALTAIPAVLSTVADVVGYFRADYNVKGQDFELKNDALASVVAGQIQKHHVYVHNFNLVDNSDVLQRFTALIRRRQELQGTVELLKSAVVRPATAEINALTAQIAALEAQLKGKEGREEARSLEHQLQDSKDLVAAHQAFLDRANAAVTESESLGTTFGTFVSAVTSAPNDKTPPMIVQAALRHHIRQQGITHLLHLSILSSGGEAITKKHFLGSGETAYVGGSAISYMLLTTAGRVLSADTRVALAQMDYNLASPDAVVYRPVRLSG